MAKERSELIVHGGSKVVTTIITSNADGSPRAEAFLVNHGMNDEKCDAYVRLATVALAQMGDELAEE